MYIIEKLIKLYIDLKHSRQIDYLPTDEIQEETLEDILTCKHNFMPIDSTGKIFACSKCGYVVSEKWLKAKRKNKKK